MDVAARLKERKAARMQRMKQIRDMSAVQRVRIEPTKEEYRKVLKHPSNNQAFRETGSVEWPLDQFTKKRIREGSVKIVEQGRGTGASGGGRSESENAQTASGGASASGDLRQKTGAKETVSSQKPAS